MIPRSQKRANETVSEWTLSAATHCCPARVLLRCRTKYRGRQFRFVSECAKAVTCPHAVSMYPVVEMIVAVFSMIPTTCVDSKLATALPLDMAIHNSKPERLNFPVLREGLCQECLFSFKSGMHAIASCGSATLSALSPQFALVCGWHKAESAE